MLLRSLPVLAVLGVAAATVGIRSHLLPPAPDGRAFETPQIRLLEPGQRALTARATAGRGRVVAILDAPVRPAPEPPAARLRGGGFDIDTRLLATAGSPRTPGVELRRLTDGARRRVTAPGGSWIHDARFTSDGRRLALDVAGPEGLHLWFVHPETGERLATVTARLSAAWGDACEWRNSADQVLCRVAVDPTSSAPEPAEPTSGRSTGDGGIDAAEFRREFTVRLAIVELASGQARPVGRPGLYETAGLAPGGGFIFVERADPGDARVVRRDDLVRTLEVWTDSGRVKRRLSGGTAGRQPRLPTWSPAAPARLVWVEQAEGERTGSVVFTLEPPFSGPPSIWFSTAGAIRRLSWGTNDALVATEERSPGGRLVTWMVGTGRGAEPRRIWNGENVGAGGK